MTTDLTDNVLTVTFTPDELDTINWISSTFGQNEINKYLSNWLAQRASQMEETQKNEFWAKVKPYPDIIELVNTEVTKKPNGIRSL